jgi:hypothetical protein
LIPRRGAVGEGYGRQLAKNRDLSEVNARSLNPNSIGTPRRISLSTSVQDAATNGLHARNTSTKDRPSIEIGKTPHPSMAQPIKLATERNHRVDRIGPLSWKGWERSTYSNRRQQPSINLSPASCTLHCRTSANRCARRNIGMIASPDETTAETVCAKEPNHLTTGIIDRHEIEFSAKLLVSAIAASLHTVDGIGLPPLRSSGVRFCPTEGLVEVQYDPPQKAIQVLSVSLGAFLVAYCIRARIPMPRLADKIIHIQANSIIVAFTTLYAEAPAPDAAMGGIQYSRTRR